MTTLQAALKALSDEAVPAPPVESLVRRQRRRRRIRALTRGSAAAVLALVVGILVALTHGASTTTTRVSTGTRSTPTTSVPQPTSGVGPRLGRSRLWPPEGEVVKGSDSPVGIAVEFARVVLGVPDPSGVVTAPTGHAGSGTLVRVSGGAGTVPFTLLTVRDGMSGRWAVQSAGHAGLVLTGQGREELLRFFLPSRDATRATLMSTVDGSGRQRLLSATELATGTVDVTPFITARRRPVYARFLLVFHSTSGALVAIEDGGPPPGTASETPGSSIPLPPPHNPPTYGNSPDSPNPPDLTAVSGSAGVIGYVWSYEIFGPFAYKTVVDVWDRTGKVLLGHLYVGSDGFLTLAQEKAMGVSPSNPPRPTATTFGSATGP